MTDRALDTTAASSGLRQRLAGVPVLVWIALTWLVAMVAVALLADLVSPYSYTAPNLRNRLVAPGHPLHWLGTDELGRDVLSRLIASIRISLLIAFGASLMSAVVGTTLGFLAAYFRGSSSSSCSCWRISRRACPSSSWRSPSSPSSARRCRCSSPDGFSSAGSAMPASPGAWPSPQAPRAMPRP